MTDQPINESLAVQLLRKDLAEVAAGILARVRAPLTQGQFDALCSFVFNVGLGHFGSSTLLKKLNAGDYAGAASEFLRWDKASGKSLPGLRERRSAERQRFLA
jgi:lysozyme